MVDDHVFSSVALPVAMVDDQSSPYFVVMVDDHSIVESLWTNLRESLVIHCFGWEGSAPYACSFQQSCCWVCPLFQARG